jgi:hypothetical protein
MKRILNFVTAVTVLAVLCVVMPAAAQGGPNCSNATLKGSYGATITGTLGPSPSSIW